MIRAGELDRRISVEHRTLVRDPDTNETIATWVQIASVRAAVRQASGREFLAGSAVIGERRAVFVIRWRGDITATDTRVIYGDGTYDLDDVREIGRREGLELHGKAVS